MTNDPALPVGALTDLRGRVVVVTGASRGIGAGIAMRLAEAGASVAVAAREPGGAAAMVERIEQTGGLARPFAFDVADEGQVQAGLGRIVDAFGTIDGLVNCAGIQPIRPLLEQSVEEWDDMMATNLRGVFLCTRKVSRVMIDRGTGGSIVNIASIEGLQPAWNHTHYNVTKAGVVMHTRAAALELGQFGIRVNAVSPGLIWSPTLEAAWPDGVARFIAHAPLGRLGQPDDVADAVLFLLSPMSRFVSGANLVVDGGVLTHPTW